MGEKRAETVIGSIISFKRGITPTKNDDTRTWPDIHINEVIYKFLAQYVKACKKKVRKTVYFQKFEFQKGHNSCKKWQINDIRTWSYEHGNEI